LAISAYLAADSEVREEWGELCQVCKDGTVIDRSENHGELYRLQAADSIFVNPSEPLFLPEQSPSQGDDDMGRGDDQEFEDEGGEDEVAGEVLALHDDEGEASSQGRQTRSKKGKTAGSLKGKAKASEASPVKGERQDHSDEKVFNSALHFAVTPKVCFVVFDKGIALTFAFQCARCVSKGYDCFKTKKNPNAKNCVVCKIDRQGCSLRESAPAQASGSASKPSAFPLTAKPPPPYKPATPALPPLPLPTPIPMGASLSLPSSFGGEPMDQDAPIASALRKRGSATFADDPKGSKRTKMAATTMRVARGGSVASSVSSHFVPNLSLPSSSSFLPSSSIGLASTSTALASASSGMRGTDPMESVVHRLDGLEESMESFYRDTKRRLGELRSMCNELRKGGDA
jgi:hypothetical protein